MNILVTQERRKRYGDEAAAVTMEISQNNDHLVDTTAKFGASRTEESAAMVHLHWARGLTDNVTGTAAERKEEEKE